MEGWLFVKGNKDERIPENCCDGEEDVDCWEWNGLSLNSPTQTGEHSDSSNNGVCVSFPVIFFVSIILQSLFLDTTRSISF